MTREIDYESIDIPPDESPENYHYTTRRAKILQRVKEAGHPDVVNWAEFAEEHGCSRQTVYHDLDVLAEYVEENLGERRALETSAVFDRCIQGLLEDEEWRDAARTVKEREDWITEYKTLQELADEIEELKTQSGSDAESEYKVK